MTQQIDASQQEIEGFASLISDHNTAIQNEKEKSAYLANAFRIWVGAKGLPPETRLIGVKDGAIQVEVPEQKPALVDDAA